MANRELRCTCCGDVIEYSKNDYDSEVRYSSNDGLFCSSDCAADWFTSEVAGDWTKEELLDKFGKVKRK